MSDTSVPAMPTTSPSRIKSLAASILLLVLRLALGWEWLLAGLEKLGKPAWQDKGPAVSGFLAGALQKTTGAHPEVFSWYGWLISHIALPNSGIIALVVTYGEIAVGIALIFGILTRLAAFGGGLMNFNYLLAGTSGLNPLMLLGSIIILYSRKATGRFGLDGLLAHQHKHSRLL